jgi:hypothetical protein
MRERRAGERDARNVERIARVAPSGSPRGSATSASSRFATRIKSWRRLDLCVEDAKTAVREHGRERTLLLGFPRPTTRGPCRRARRQGRAHPALPSTPGCALGTSRSLLRPGWPQQHGASSPTAPSTCPTRRRLPRQLQERPVRAASVKEQPGRPSGEARQRGRASTRLPLSVPSEPPLRVSNRRRRCVHDAANVSLSEQACAGLPGCDRSLSRRASRKAVDVRRGHRLTLFSSANVLVQNGFRRAE